MNLFLFGYDDEDDDSDGNDGDDGDDDLSDLDVPFVDVQNTVFETGATILSSSSGCALQFHESRPTTGPIADCFVICFKNCLVNYLGDRFSRN